MTALAKLANPFVLMGLIVAVLFGLYKWEGAKLKRAKLEIEGVRKSLTMAEVSLQDAQAVNQAAIDELAKQAAEVERQKQIAALEAKKSRQRLDAFNALNREIANVKDNPPVPDALELNLDAARLRGAVAGSSGPAASGLDQGPDGATAGSDRPVVPSPASSPAQAPGA